MVVSSIWNVALCAAAYGAHANNATLAAIHTQRGFLLMISSPRVRDDRVRFSRWRATVAGVPPEVHPHVATVGPTQVRKR
jgi:hypothetical protein